MLPDHPEFIPFLFHQFFEIIPTLHVHPEASRRPKEPRQPDRRVGGDLSPSLDNRVYSGRIHENALGKCIRCYAHGIEKLFFQNLTRGGQLY